MTKWDDLFNPPAEASTIRLHAVPDAPPGTSTSYAAAALRREAEEVAQAANGTRNQTLNKAWFNMGRHVGAGNIDPTTVRDTLAGAAAAAGLPQHEIDTVLRDGSTSALNAGAALPRHPAPLNPIPTATLLHEKPQKDASDAPDGAEEALEASWAPIDLTSVLDGTWVPEVASLMPRSDGPCLLYPGRIHSFHGESESGKSLVAQAEAARLLAADMSVLYLDFESDHAAVTGRMLELGCTPAQVAKRFTYVRPEVDPRRFDHERHAVAQLLGRPYALAVIDGVTDALGIFGSSTKDNDEISAFMRVLPRTVARLTGAAVVLIDHVTKDADTRGRFAIGGQAKMAGLDGAAYVVEVVEALGRGRRGTVTLRIAKDRPGGVRAHAGPFRRTDRTQEAARITVDSTPEHGQPEGRIRVIVGEPQHGEGGLDQPAEFRPTRIMEAVSKQLEDAGEPLSMNTLEGLVSANRDTVRKAVAILVKEHFAREESGPRNARMHRSTRPYREFRDHLSDAYIPPTVSLTSPTSPDFAPTSPGRGGADLAPPLPPPTGRGEVSRAKSEGVTSPEETGEVDVACSRCFRPMPQGLYLVSGGLCAGCYDDDKAELKLTTIDRGETDLEDNPEEGA